MLGLLIRGFFLLTVVGWYSTSLWRMIDGYFKGQFQRYLEEEYERNPKMRDDVRRGYGEAAGKAASPLTEELLRDCGLAEECSSSSSSLVVDVVGEADRALAPSRVVESGPPAGAAVEEEEGKEVDGPEEPAFRGEADAEPPDGALTDGTGNKSTADSTLSIDETEPGQQQQQQPDSQNLEAREERRQRSETNRRPERSGKKRKLSGRPLIGAKSEKAARKSQRSEPLTLTREDFERAARRGNKYRYTTDDEGNVMLDREFSEFDDDNSWSHADDEEEGEGESDDGAAAKRRGMPIGDLPYKPAVDIYDLDRLPEDEFCPLTLDDDPSCEESRAWP